MNEQVNKEEKRFCRWCGEALVRKTYRNGKDSYGRERSPRLERDEQFTNRRFCDSHCMGSYFSYLGGPLKVA